MIGARHAGEAYREIVILILALPALHLKNPERDPDHSLERRRSWWRVPCCRADSRQDREAGANTGRLSWARGRAGGGFGLCPHRGGRHRRADWRSGLAPSRSGSNASAAACAREAHARKHATTILIGNAPPAPVRRPNIRAAARATKRCAFPASAGIIAATVMDDNGRFREREYARRDAHPHERLGVVERIIALLPHRAVLRTQIGLRL